MDNKAKAEKLHDWVRDHGDWPTLKCCQEFLDELDKPELDPGHKRFLQSLLDEKGCIVKVGGKWRWLALATNDCGVDLGRMKAATGTYDEDVNKMIDLGLLNSELPVNTVGESGMELYAFVTNDGIEALKQ